MTERQKEMLKIADDMILENERITKLIHFIHWKMRMDLSAKREFPQSRRELIMMGSVPMFELMAEVLLSKGFDLDWINEFANSGDGMVYTEGKNKGELRLVTPPKPKTNLFDVMTGADND